MEWSRHRTGEYGHQRLYHIAGDLGHAECVSRQHVSWRRLVVCVDGVPGFVGKFLPKKLRKYVSFYIGNVVRTLYVELKVVK